MFKILGNFFDSNEKEIRRLRSLVVRMSDLEEDVKKLKDADFVKKTAQFRQQLTTGTTLEEILPEAYAMVREAAWRTLHLRHFDVQLIAALALHEGKVSESCTHRVCVKTYV